MSSLSRFWSDISNNLRLEYGDTVYNSWITPIEPLKIEDDIFYLAVKNDFLKEWISKHYLSRILHYSKNHNAQIRQVEIMINHCKREFGQPQNNDMNNLKFKESENDYNIIKSIPLDKNLTFDEFVVGKSNELAYAAAKRIAESETTVYNPLFLYSGVGLGKTHLMHSIAWSIREKYQYKKIIYLSAEKFMYQFIKALRYRNTMDFKDQFRTIDVLMIDDIQFICGKDSTQEEFFHTFNELVNNNRQVIISADKSPNDLEGMENRLKSRLGWGLVADIDKTTFELRVSILESKIARTGVEVPGDVVNYLADTIDSNVRELEGALNKVIASSNFFGQSITLDHTKNVLKDLVKSYDKKVTIEDIQQKVASYYTIKMSDLFSHKRIKQLITPRQVAMYLSKDLTTLSLPDIGKKFGGRDHTTIIYAVKKIESLLQTDKGLVEDIRNLKRIL